MYYKYYSIFSHLAASCALNSLSVLTYVLLLCLNANTHPSSSHSAVAHLRSHRPERPGLRPGVWQRGCAPRVAPHGLAAGGHRIFVRRDVAVMIHSATIKIMR